MPRRTMLAKPKTPLTSSPFEVVSGGQGEVAAVDEPVAVEQHQAFGGHDRSVPGVAPGSVVIGPFGGRVVPRPESAELVSRRRRARAGRADDEGDRRQRQRAATHDRPEDPSAAAVVDVAACWIDRPVLGAAAIPTPSAPRRPPRPSRVPKPPPVVSAGVEGAAAADARGAPAPARAAAEAGAADVSPAAAGGPGSCGAPARDAGAAAFRLRGRAAAGGRLAAAAAALDPRVKRRGRRCRSGARRSRTSPAPTPSGRVKRRATPPQARADASRVGRRLAACGGRQPEVAAGGGDRRRQRTPSRGRWRRGRRGAPRTRRRTRSGRWPGRGRCRRGHRRRARPRASGRGDRGRSRGRSETWGMAVRRPPASAIGPVADRDQPRNSSIRSASRSRSASRPRWMRDFTVPERDAGHRRDLRVVVALDVEQDDRGSLVVGDRARARRSAPRGARS